MSASLIPNIKFRWFDNNGNPLSGGLVYSYISGTSTPANTFSDEPGTTPNTNPVVLDSAGYAAIYLDDSISYRIVVKTSTGVTIQDVSNVTGTSPTVTASTVIDETVTATQGQTLIPFTLSYIPGSGALQVSLNGAVQVLDTDYSETDANSITFATGLNAGDVVYARNFTTAVFTAPNAAVVPYSGPDGDTYVASALDDLYGLTDALGKDIRTYAGIVADGVTDDFVALQAAFNTAYTNNETIYFPSGVYCRVVFTVAHPNLFIHGKVSLRGANSQNCGFRIYKDYDNTPIVHSPLFCFGIASKGATVDAWRGTMQGIGFIVEAGCGTYERTCHFYEWQNATVRDCYFDSRAVTWALAKMAGGFLASNVQPTWAVGQSAFYYGMLIDNNEAHASAYYQNSEPIGFTNLADSVIQNNRFYGFSDDIGIHGGNNILVQGNTHSTLLGRLYVEDATNVTLRDNLLIRCKQPDNTYTNGSGGTVGCRVTMSSIYYPNNACVAPNNIIITGNRFVIPSGAWMSTVIYCENVQDGLIVDGNIVDNQGSADTTTGILSIVQTLMLGTWVGPVGNPDYTNGGVIRLRSAVVTNNLCVGPGWVDGDGSLGIAAVSGQAAVLGPITISKNTVGGIYASYNTGIYVKDDNRSLPVTTQKWLNVSPAVIEKVLHEGIIAATDNFNFANHPVGTPLTIKDRGGLDFFAPQAGSIRGYRVEVAAAASAPNLFFARVMKTTGGVRAQLGSDISFATNSPSTNCISYTGSYTGAAMDFAAGDKLELLMYNAAGQVVALTGNVKMLGLYA